jgi:hypothetical protein
MERILCPICGAYWRCDCDRDAIYLPVDENCDHDWLEAVGVEVDIEPAGGAHKAMVCRLCGLYSVVRASSDVDV